MNQLELHASRTPTANSIVVGDVVETNHGTALFGASGDDVEIFVGGHKVQQGFYVSLETGLLLPEDAVVAGRWVGSLHLGLRPVPGGNGEFSGLASSIAARGTDIEPGAYGLAKVNPKCTQCRRLEGGYDKAIRVRDRALKRYDEARTAIIDSERAQRELEQKARRLEDSIDDGVREYMALQQIASDHRERNFELADQIEDIAEDLRNKRTDYRCAAALAIILAVVLTVQYLFF